MPTLSHLFSPLSIGTMQLKNRLAMAPMATDFAEADGTVTDRLLDYLVARATGGVGLIIMEVATIDGTHPYMPRTVGLYDDAHIPGLRRLTDAVHAHGARIIPQVCHPGPESLGPLFTGSVALGPTAGIVNNITKQRCRALAVEELPPIIDQFGVAAARAREAGCDGIELHAAHSYMLLGSFLSAMRNQRVDDFGGDLHGRARPLLQVLGSVRAHAGADFPVVVRLSGDELIPGGRGLRETVYLARLLEQAGASALHISGGVYPDLAWRVIPPYGTPLGLNVAAAAAIKQAVTIPVMVVGRIHDPRLADDIIARGEADAVVMGRALLADPELPNKAADGRFDEIAPCIACGQGCIYAREQGEDMTCVVNPAVGREAELELRPAVQAKKVMVVGGGPAGLEAAAVASLRGHQVDLYEQAAELGGTYRLAFATPSKRELAALAGYLARRAQGAGVRVHLATAVTPQLVAQAKPAVVILATGGRPTRPPIPGADGEQVVFAHEVLSGAREVLPGAVLVIGGGSVGCEVAEHLANPGDNHTIGEYAVTVVEQREAIGLDLSGEARAVLMPRLREKGVRCLTAATVKELTTDGAVIVQQGEEITLRGFSLIVLATGSSPDQGLVAPLRAVGFEPLVIGDAVKVRSALEAIREGAEAGRRV